MEHRRTGYTRSSLAKLPEAITAPTAVTGGRDSSPRSLTGAAFVGDDTNELLVEGLDAEVSWSGAMQVI